MVRPEGGRRSCLTLGRLLTDNVIRRIYATNPRRVGVTFGQSFEPLRPGYLCSKPGCKRLSYSGPSTMCSEHVRQASQSFDWWKQYANKHDSGVPGRAEVM